MPCPIHKSVQILEAKTGVVWFAVCRECDYVEIQIYDTATDNPAQAMLRTIVLKEADEFQKALPMAMFGEAHD